MIFNWLPQFEWRLQSSTKIKTFVKFLLELCVSYILESFQQNPKNCFESKLEFETENLKLWKDYGHLWIIEEWLPFNKIDFQYMVRSIIWAGISGPYHMVRKYGRLYKVHSEILHTDTMVLSEAENFSNKLMQLSSIKVMLFCFLSKHQYYKHHETDCTTRNVL